MTSISTMTQATGEILNCGLSAENGYEWNCTVEQYENLCDAAAEGLFRGTYVTPEEALRGEALRMGIAKESDF